MVRLSLHPAALAEFFNAVGFYETQTRGLGLRFYDEVTRVFELLAQNPDIAPFFDAPYRRYVCREFPFNVVYRIADGHVVILAIMHQPRHPGYWKTRV